MKVRVKICGIKTVEDAEAAIKAGADFLGFNFVPSSSRYVTESQTKEIILRLGKNKPHLVGVFQNQPLDFVNKIANDLELDFVQLHGEEAPEYCEKISRPIIKAFRLDFDFDLEAVSQTFRNYKVEYFLLDRKKRGEGQLLNSDKVKILAQNFPLILAGGLTPENVGEAVKNSGEIKAVDVAGGVEILGVKDGARIHEFIVESKKNDVF